MKNYEDKEECEEFEQVEYKPGKIFAAISKCMLEMGAIKKDRANRQQGFKFRGIDDVYNALQKVLANNKVFTTTEIFDIERCEVKTAKGGTGYHAIIKYKFRFWAEDGSYVTCHAIGEGIDYGDKVSNKCASIAHKYALLQTFCIPTEEADPDFDSPKVGVEKWKLSRSEEKRILTLLKASGRSEKQLKELVKKMYDTENLTDLGMAQVKELSALLEKKAKESQGDSVASLNKKFSET